MGGEEEQDTDKLLSLVKQRLKQKLERDCGPVFMSAFRDPKTIELTLNPDGKLWRERLGEKMEMIGKINPIQAQAILKAVAAFNDLVVTVATPKVECNFPLDGSRFAGQYPPIVQEASFAIRKKAIHVFTLHQYVEQGVMTVQQCDALKEAVRQHKNILVIGGTSSGKTTLLNALIHEMWEQEPTERILTLEDTAELQCLAENKVQLFTSAFVSMTELVKGTLRQRPDRVLVGEVRDGTALDLLDVWNTGHPGGAASLHANNARAGLTRLKSLISRNRSAPAEIEPLIGEAVQVVVHIAKTQTRGRKVMEILEISGYENSGYTTQTR